MWGKGLAFLGEVPEGQLGQKQHNQKASVHALSLPLISFETLWASVSLICNMKGLAWSSL